MENNNYFMRSLILLTSIPALTIRAATLLLSHSNLAVIIGVDITAAAFIISFRRLIRKNHIKYQEIGLVIKQLPAS
jgi:hypothetical protein